MVYRTSWEGWQAEIRTSYLISPERTPAESLCWLDPHDSIPESQCSNF